jgi:hypothetical protein
MLSINILIAVMVARQVVPPGRTEIWGEFRLPGRQSTGDRDAGGRHREGGRSSASIRMNFISAPSLPDLADCESL